MGGIKRRKSKKRLDARIKAFESGGSGPGNNPGKQSGDGHKMHKPGSNTR